MTFIKDNGATSHTFQEVRTAARELTVTLYVKVGDDVDWESHLAGLRVKQREEYEHAFENVRNGGAPVSSRKGTRRISPSICRSTALPPARPVVSAMSCCVCSR